jgi:hypothetical protein
LQSSSDRTLLDLRFCQNAGWVVERTFAWISRNRRLERDFERYSTTVVAFIRLAMIRIMLRRLAANHSS